MNVPSENLQTALESFESNLRKEGLNGREEWVVMAGALIGVYRAFNSVNELHFVFIKNNPFDCAMLAWCIKAERRTQEIESSTGTPATAKHNSSMQPEQNAKDTALPLPSQNLQTIMGMYETSFKSGPMKDAAPWNLMAAALIAGYRTFKAGDDLELMFDFDNSFDKAMLVWCVEAERRKDEFMKKSASNPNRN